MHAEIPPAFAVAQQIHHDETAMDPPQVQPPWHAAAALVPDASTRRAIRKAIGCILRPYPIDDNDPEASRRRIVIVASSVALVVSAALIATRTRRARRA